MRITWRERLFLEPEWQNINNWPTVDAMLCVPKKDRKLFNRNLAIVSRFLQGESQKQLAVEHGLDPSRVSQLLQRVLGGEENEPPLLSQGLFPKRCPSKIIRRAPLSKVDDPRGARGAFSHLLSAVPGLKEYLDKKIAGFVQRKPEGQNLNPQTFHQAFISHLKKHNWPSNTYPYTETSLAYQSTYRYFSEQVKIQLLLKESSRTILPITTSLRIGEETQIDEHLAHMHVQVGVVLNGVMEALRLSRISLLVLRDVASHCVLSYSLALTASPSQEDIQQLINKLEQPWEPFKLKTPGLCYLPGAGFPSGLNESSRRITLGIVRFDNALVHKAKSVRSSLLNHFGATINYGLVRTPKARNLIEQAFKRLNDNLHRVPSTSGSHTQDPKSEPRKHKKKSPVITFQALEEMIEILLANENASQQPQLGGYSPLDVWSYQIDNLFIPLRPKIPDQVFQPFLDRKVVTVRKPKNEHRNPFINFEKVRYNGSGLHRAELINKQILILFDRRDIRTLKASTLDGKSLGIVVAPKTWQRFKHSLKTRKMINKMIYEQRIGREDPLGGYFDYLLTHRKIPTEALKLVKLYQEYGMGQLFPSSSLETSQANTFTPSKRNQTGIPDWDPGMIGKRK